MNKDVDNIKRVVEDIRYLIATDCCDETIQARIENFIAEKQGQTYPLGDVSLDEQSETTVCDNPHCINGTVEVIYGEPIRCSICDEQTGN